MMDHIAAYTAWADYMDNAPMSDVFTDTYHNTLMALWMAYIEALSNGTATQAYSDLITLKTPTSAPVTDIDPQPAALTHKRYFGTFHMRDGFAYVHAKELLNELNVTAVCGMTPPQVPQGALVEFSANASFSHALRVVVVDNAVSEAAYERMKQAQTAPRIDTTRRPRNLAEARLQAEQRKKDAAQREEARRNAHQIAPTVEFNNGAGYEMDGLASDYDNIDMTF